MEGAFVWTFADPWLIHTADPRHDLDMTSTSLVKTYERGQGTTYPGMPWEPKQAFGAVASFYAAHWAERDLMSGQAEFLRRPVAGQSGQPPHVIRSPATPAKRMVS